jgi:hypothetical protein
MEFLEASLCVSLYSLSSPFVICSAGRPSWCILMLATQWFTSVCVISPSFSIFHIQCTDSYPMIGDYATPADLALVINLGSIVRLIPQPHTHTHVRRLEGCRSPC